MSVPQSERRQSKCEYAVILQQVEQYFVSILGDPECKTYIPGLTEKLFELAADAYNDATLYFEMSIGTVRGDLPSLKKYCKKSIWDIRVLAAQINIYIAERMRQNKPIQGLIDTTGKLFKAQELLTKELGKLDKSWYQQKVQDESI
jgi:hypothetical protein